MYRGFLTSSLSRRRSLPMFCVSEFSVTEASPHTAFSSSSFEISFWGFCNRYNKTRNAFGSTCNTSPDLTRQTSRSRTSTPEKRKTNDLPSVISLPIQNQKNIRDFSRQKLRCEPRVASAESAGRNLPTSKFPGGQRHYAHQCRTTPDICRFTAVCRALPVRRVRGDGRFSRPTTHPLRRAELGHEKVHRH